MWFYGLIIIIIIIIIIGDGIMSARTMRIG
jgi:hypothetical protein